MAGEIVREMELTIENHTVTLVVPEKYDVTSEVLSIITEMITQAESLTGHCVYKVFLNEHRVIRNRFHNLTMLYGREKP